MKPHPHRPEEASRFVTLPDAGARLTRNRAGGKKTSMAGISSQGVHDRPNSGFSAASSQWAIGQSRNNGNFYAPDPLEISDYAESDSRHGPLIIALAGSVTLILGVVVWNLYRDHRAVIDDDKIPVIATQPNPARLPGSQISSQNADEDASLAPVKSSAIDSLLESQATATNNSKPAGLVELPADLSAAKPDPTGLQPVEDPRLPVENGQGGPQILAASTNPQPVGAPKGGMNLAIVDDRAIARTVPDNAALTPKSPRSASQAPASTRQAAVKTTLSYSIQSSGAYGVQLGSVRSLEAAEMLWQELRRIAPQDIARVQQEVERAELGEQGVFYRVRAGAFPDRVSANAFCQAMNSHKRACLVVARK